MKDSNMTRKLMEIFFNNLNLALIQHLSYKNINKMKFC